MSLNANDCALHARGVSFRGPEAAQGRGERGTAAACPHLCVSAPALFLGSESVSGHLHAISGLCSLQMRGGAHWVRRDRRSTPRKPRRHEPEELGGKSESATCRGQKVECILKTAATAVKPVSFARNRDGCTAPRWRQLLAPPLSGPTPGARVIFIRRKRLQDPGVETLPRMCGVGLSAGVSNIDLNVIFPVSANSMFFSAQVDASAILPSGAHKRPRRVH